MAAYFIKIYFRDDTVRSFRVKDPRKIEVMDLRSTSAYGLVVIEKSKKSSHITVGGTCDRGRRDIPFRSGTLNPFHSYIKGYKNGLIYAMEVYHNWRSDDSEGYSKVTRLVIEKRDNNGVEKICDLSGFDEIKDNIILDGFSTEKGIRYYRSREPKCGGLIDDYYYFERV